MGYIPRHEEITGTSLSGSSGDINRTYSIAYSSSINSLFSVSIQGTPAQINLQFTKSGDTITFLNPIYNEDKIVLDYLTSESTSTLTVTDITTTDLARFINIEGKIPDYSVIGEDRLKETIGTGDSSTRVFFTDKPAILNGTYTLYYGASESNPTALVETTDYVIDKDLGKVTLTVTGLSTVGTANIYGAYSYVKLSHGLTLTDTQLQTALDMAQNKFENDTYNKWTDGTAATPDWGIVSNEKHDGQGQYLRGYYLNNYPIPNITTALSSDVAIGATSIDVDSTDGFPSSGTISIGTDKILYTGKTSSSFTGTTGIVSAHITDDLVYPYCFEISTTESGSNAVWQALNNGSEYDLDFDTGRVHLYTDNINLDVYSQSNPPRLVPNRFRASYIYGNDTVPQEVKQVILMLASKQLLHTTGRRTTLDGVNGPAIPNVEIDDKLIKDTTDSWRNFKIDRI